MTHGREQINFERREWVGGKKNQEREREREGMKLASGIVTMHG